MSNLSENMLLDFTALPSSQCWETLDDDIIGGCSQSIVQSIEKTGLCFSGVLSLENNCGFASIRSNCANYNLGEYSSLKLRLRGDGKSYKLSLRTDCFFDGVSYQANFVTEQNRWQEICLPFRDFIATHHGAKLSTVAPVDTSRIASFGLFIADAQEGPFRLELAWIKAA